LADLDRRRSRDCRCRAEAMVEALAKTLELIKDFLAVQP
jgi:hypothetical protein